MESVEVVVTQAGVDVTTWTVVVTGRPAREALDELARLSLAAFRSGYDVELRGPSARCLRSLMGLEVRDDAEDDPPPD